MDVGPSTHTCPFPRVSVGVVQGAGDLNRTYGSLLTTSSLAWALRRGRCCGTGTRPHLSGAPEVPPDGVSRGKLQQPLLPPPTPSAPQSWSPAHTPGTGPGQTGRVWCSPPTSLPHNYPCASWLSECATQSTRKEFTHSCAVGSQPSGHRVSTVWARAPRAFGDMCSSVCSIHSWSW